MSRVIFVDDEPNILAGLRRMLRTQRNEWDMSFVEGGQAALECLQQGNVDVVISDMRMPVMDGAELLGQIRASSPEVIRLCLSGYSEENLVLRGLTSIHQYLTKPCESVHLTETVRAILAAGDRLSPELRCRVAGLSALPCRGSSLKALGGALEKPSMDSVSQIVAADLGMASRVVQLVHSGFFGLAGHLERVEDACERLGPGNLRKLLGVADGFPSDPSLDDDWLTALGHRSQRLSHVAGLLATRAGLPSKSCDHARLAGALHGVGELALAACRWSGDPSLVVEVTSSFLLTVWGLPEPVARCAYFRTPAAAGEPKLGPLLMVHLANHCLTPGGEALDQGYLQDLGVLDQAQKWMEACPL